MTCDARCDLIPPTPQIKLLTALACQAVQAGVAGVCRRLRPRPRTCQCFPLLSQ